MEAAATGTDAIDLAYLQTWIGRTEDADDVVTPRLASEYRATFAPHLAEVAPTDAPLMLQWVLAPALAPAAELTSDGHMKRGGFLPPVPLPRRMWAGGAVETSGRLRIGDNVRRISRIEDVSMKTGRSGTLCFVTVRHEYRVGDDVRLRERHDIVYREATSPGAAKGKTAGAAPAGVALSKRDLTWTVEPTETMLFRYSALTFNAHRIHYDLPYATGTEGYAGLVVHGPLQGALLFNIATALGGKEPAHFTYRGLSPLIAPKPFHVHGQRNVDGSLHCWTENSDGVTCMDAQAR